MFVLYLSAVIEAHISLQKENSEPEKTKKKTQKELEIKKAKATTAAQNEADEVVAELKIMHPVCSEHCTHCWLGHPSGEHVTLSEMQFCSWAMEYVRCQTKPPACNTRTHHLYQLCCLKIPEDKCSVTLEKPPNTRMFDVPPSGLKHHQSISTASISATPMPSITVNIPDMVGSCMAHASQQQSQSPLIASDPADYIDEPWPTLHDFLCGIKGKDRHKCDFISHEAAL
jgi:hypothetical protein